MENRSEGSHPSHRSLYHYYIDTIPIPLFEVNGDFTITMVNRKAKERWGSIKEGESKFSDIIKSDEDINKKIIEHTLINRSSISEVIKTRNDEYFEVKTRYLGGEKSSKVLVFLLDNTLQKRLQFRLLDSIERTDNLLANLLPMPILEEFTIDEVEETSISMPRIVEETTIVFIDFVNFSEISLNTDLKLLIKELELHFRYFDKVVKEFELEKLKTIGDGYMFAGGLFTPGSEIEKSAEATLKIRDFIKTREWQARIGMSSGSCIAGLISGWRMLYDVWGPTVNLAYRLLQACEPDRINVSESVCELLSGGFELVFRGEIEAHNIGPLPMYYLIGSKQL